MSMQNGEPQVYTSLATLRNAQVQLQWSFFQLLFIFNSAALSVGFSNRIDETLKVVLAWTALLVQFGLYFASSRAIHWLDYYDYDNKLAALENLDQEDATNRSRVSVFSTDEFHDKKGSWWARRGYLLVYALGIIVWLRLTIYYTRFFF
jgi:hypothetical protein